MTLRLTRPPRSSALSNALQILLESVYRENCIPDLASLSEVDRLDYELNGLSLSRDHVLQEIPKRLLTLKRQRNTRVPWARLPVELQEQVFLEDVSELSGRPFLKRSLTLSSVSSRWRAAVIGSPRLWTFADPRLSEFLEIVLARSKSASLDVVAEARGYYAENMSQMQSIVEHHQRWRSLVCSGRYVAKIKDILQLQAPLLQTLRLHNPITSDRVSLGGGPQLRHLDLEDVFPANIGSIALPELKTLRIGHAWATPQEYLALLEECPLLEAFDLYGLCPEDRPQSRPVPTPNPLALPRLKKIKFTACEDAITSFLIPLLQAPSLSSLFIANSAGNIDFVRALCGTDRDWSLPEAVARNTSLDQLTVRWGEFGAVILGSSGENCVLRLEVDSLDWNDAMPGELQLFPSSHTKIPLELVLVDYADGLQTIQLAQFPTLTTLSIGEGIREKDVIDFLSPLLQPQASNDGTDRWVAPRLSKIRFSDFPKVGTHLDETIARLKLARNRSNLGGSDGVNKPAELVVETDDSV